MIPAKVERLVVLVDKALSAAKEMRLERARLDEDAWKKLTDALLDARSALMKERGKEDS